MLQHAETPPSQQTKQTILIIEDCQRDYMVLKQRIMKMYPHTDFLYADCLRDAYTLSKKQHYDIVILDLNLPDGYGLKTIEAVKKFHRHTPIIVITGMDINNFSPENREKMGTTDFISKGDLMKPSSLQSLGRLGCF